MIEKLQHGCITGTELRYLVDEGENVHLSPDVRIPLREQYHMSHVPPSLSSRPRVGEPLPSGGAPRRSGEPLSSGDARPRGIEPLSAAAPGRRGRYSIEGRIRPTDVPRILPGFGY